MGRPDALAQISQAKESQRSGRLTQASKRPTDAQIDNALSEVQRAASVHIADASVRAFPRGTSALKRQSENMQAKQAVQDAGGWAERVVQLAGEVAAAAAALRARQEAERLSQMQNSHTASRDGRFTRIRHRGSDGS